MHRETGRLSLAESLVAEGLGQNARLERIHQAVDWDPFQRIVGDLYAAAEGRPSYPPLTMMKVLLLAQWYGLSDPQMEEALGDRLSFRRFVGLGLQDPTPDPSTLSRFRSALGSPRAAALFQELTGQLEAQGLVLKQGTLLDATVVEAQVRRPPRAAGLGAGSPRDPDAGWSYTGRGSRTHFGYKVHIGVDLETGLVRRGELTAANVYESQVAEALICGDEGAVYADKAYESTDRRTRLKAQGVKDRILHRSHKHQRALPHWQQRRNALIAPRRDRVEKVFGTLKRSYGYTRVRYRGLPRNTLEMYFKLMAFNLRKAVRLQAV